MRRDVFQAIADPTRREIIQVISGGAYTLNTVADKFNISRPAISRHIKILAECGLVNIRQEGRERYCEAKLEKLHEVSQWVEGYRVFWTKKLDALGEFLAKDAEMPIKAARKKAASKVGAKSQRVTSIKNK